MRRVWAAAGAALALPLSLVHAYLLTLLAAALAQRARRRPLAPPRPTPSVVVLVPAHDEQDGIAATIASLGNADVVVVADNCSDRTAEVAVRAGATVLERRDPARRGKGHALAWALDHLPRPDVDVIAMVDADCVASPNLVAELGGAIARGAAAAQARYEVANVDASAATALRAGAFALWNTVRPLGKERLGLSCGLLGTGMAFRRDVLERVPWSAFSVAEDAEYHARLVAAGVRVAFVAEASVTSNMPLDLRATEQQLRWEGGRAAVARAWTPRLLAGGLRRRDHRAVHAAIELAIPPQSLQLAAALAAGLAAWLSHRRALGRVAVANLAAQALYVLGGLALAGAPRAAYRALVAAPLLMAQKLWIYARILAVGGPRTWVRTTRAAST